MLRAIPIITALLISTSCVNPLNVITAERYYQNGTDLANQNKWGKARIAYGRALTNVEWGNLPDKTKALYSFNFGRASGVLCDWDNAEKYLEQALTIYSKTEPQLHYELIALAQMNQARGDYKKASEYYSKTIEDVKKHNVDKQMPMAFADTLLKYSEVESKLGNTEKSLQIKNQANVILNNNPDKKLPPAAPYGKFCHLNTK
jgi:tetratricopeptide (TPR) repeat protein